MGCIDFVTNWLVSTWLRSMGCCMGSVPGWFLPVAVPWVVWALFLADFYLSLFHGLLELCTWPVWSLPGVIQSFLGVHGLFNGWSLPGGFMGCCMSFVPGWSLHVAFPWVTWVLCDLLASTCHCSMDCMSSITGLFLPVAVPLVVWALCYYLALPALPWVAWAL